GLGPDHARLLRTRGAARLAVRRLTRDRRAEDRGDRAHARRAAVRLQIRIRNRAAREPHARDRALRRRGRAARARAAGGVRSARWLRSRAAASRNQPRAAGENRAMPSARRRRFRGTLFVTTREEHERLTVAVTRMPG